jgi:BlaI family transcriptional regulator, penicillinase repressor
MSRSRTRPAPPPAELPNAEAEVLAFVRQQGGATTRQVCEGLAGQRKMGPSAAQALLLRLEAKGLLKREKITGTKAYRYVPTAQADGACRNLARRFVDRLFAGSPAALMASLFDTRQPTAREIEELRRLIEKQKPHHKDTEAQR